MACKLLEIVVQKPVRPVLKGRLVALAAPAKETKLRLERPVIFCLIRKRLTILKQIITSVIKTKRKVRGLKT